MRRRSVLETAAAARGVNDRTCCNLGITRQLFRSIGISGGHSTILLGGGLDCPGDRSCHNVLLPVAPATEVKSSIDTTIFMRCVKGRGVFRRKRAVDDNEKELASGRAGGMDKRKVPWYPLKQLNSRPRNWGTFSRAQNRQLRDRASGESMLRTEDSSDTWLSPTHISLAALNRPWVVSD